MTSTQVMKKENNALATPMAQHNTPVLRSDIVVPYVVIAQGTSEAVKNRTAQLGDIYRSTSGEKLADPDTQLEVIFLHYPKSTWIIEQKPKNATRFEYRRTIPRTADNETLPWNFFADDDGVECEQGVKGATEWRRVKCLTTFAILAKDIEAAANELKKLESGDLPDPSKALTPVVISFRAMSFNAGKEICTFWTKANSMRVPIWRYMVKLSCKLEHKDDNSFYVWTADTNKPTPVAKENVPLVQEWADMVSASATNLKVDDGAASEGYENIQEVSPTAKEVV